MLSDFVGFFKVSAWNMGSLLDASGIGVSKRGMIYDIWTGPSIFLKRKWLLKRYNPANHLWVTLHPNEHIR